SALAKISNGAARIPNEYAERHPETGQLMIINPLAGGGRDKLFSTHPDTQNRIDRLMDMAGSGAAVSAASDAARRGPNTGPWG
ncbi:MAG: protease HtpX, partial [Pseudomonadota bacterium]